MNGSPTCAYRIAGLSLTADAPLAFFENFRTAVPETPDAEILRCTEPFSGLWETAAEHTHFSVLRDPSGNWLYRTAQDIAAAELSVSADYRVFRYRLPGTVLRPAQLSALNNLMRAALECRLAREGSVSLHAACVEMDGQAAAFTGVSGTGKSTRAAAWADALGAAWISGDRPCVRTDRDPVTVCGVPWDGKERVYRQTEVPLKAILEVRRSDKTEIRRLSEPAARAILVKQCFIPMWDTDTAFAAMLNIRRLSGLVPVCRLSCGPDADSARRAYGILYHHPEEITEETAE